MQFLEMVDKIARRRLKNHWALLPETWLWVRKETITPEPACDSWPCADQWHPRQGTLLHCRRGAVQGAGVHVTVPPKRVLFEAKLVQK